MQPGDVAQLVPELAGQNQHAGERMADRVCRAIGVDLAAPEHSRTVLVTVEIRPGQPARVLVQREISMSEADVLVHVQELSPASAEAAERV